MPERLTDAELADLEAKAEKAPQGPWFPRWGGEPGYIFAPGTGLIASIPHEQSDARPYPVSEYIARCSPQAILVIIAELRAHRDREQTPIPMLLFCPACGHQHVDAPESKSGWTNPPHKSHSCRSEDGGCGLIWRPADVPTTGVATIQTRGSADTWDGKATAESSLLTHRDREPAVLELMRLLERIPLEWEWRIEREAVLADPRLKGVGEQP